MVGCSHTNGFMEEPLDLVGQHIDEFIHVGRRKREVGYSSFDGDSIYDIEGGFRVKNDNFCPLECLFTLLYNSDVWKHDDMALDLFCPSKDEWFQYAYVDLQPFFGDYHFEHSEQSPDEYSQSFSCSNFDEHKNLVILEKLETYTTKEQCFHPEVFYEDMQMKRK
jgi:hypothetical protein